MGLSSWANLFGRTIYCKLPERNLLSAVRPLESASGSNEASGGGENMKISETAIPAPPACCVTKIG